MNGLELAVRGVPVLTGLRTAVVPPHAWTSLGACPVCHNGGRLDDVVRVEGTVPGSALARCQACSHLFQRRRPTPQWFDEFYAGEWDAAGRASAPATPLVPDHSTVSICAAHLPAGARVLDAGAGLGHAAAAFAERGFAVLALERSAHRAAALRARGFETHEVALEQLELPKPVQLVHLKHVLEHVDDPRAALEACRSLLAPSGLVFVAVPRWSGEHALQSAHFVPHLSLFGERSLGTLLRATGFEPIVLEVDRELRALARMDGQPTPTRDACPLALDAWLTRAAGGAGEGPRTAFWWKGDGPETYFEERVAADRGRRRLRGALLARSTEGRRGRSVARMVLGVPREARLLRALQLDVLGESEGPLRLRYEGEPPVWIK